MATDTEMLQTMQTVCEELNTEPCDTCLAMREFLDQFEAGEDSKELQAAFLENLQ